jgi:NADH-quinone oxidoreductase subunit J
MLMNLNKENEVHKPRITRLEQLFLLFDLVVFNFGFINSKPIMVNTLTGEDYNL